LDGGNRIPQIVFYQDDIGGLDGDIRSGSDRDPYIGSRQSGCIVYAVPDHGHFPVLRLNLSNFPFFVLGQHLRDHAISMNPTLNDGSGSFVITGQHDNGEPHRFKLVDGFATGGFDAIGGGNDAD